MVDSKFINKNLRTNLFYLVAIFGGYSFFFYFGSKYFSREITLCPFKRITSIPCPGCGMGRATLELAHGNILSSLLLHPLAIPFNIAVSVAVIWLVKDVITGNNSFVNFIKAKRGKWFFLIIAIILFVVWIQNILIGI